MTGGKKTNTHILNHHAELKQCRQCSEMIPPVITGNAVCSPVMSVGQAPGIHEGKVLKPFGWTAGKTLFKWFERIGVDEETYRQHVYMAAVCRCFPGKSLKGGGDRVPSKGEIANCDQWLKAEYQLLQPELILPIGKLAIQQYLDVKKLTEVVGQVHQIELEGRAVDIIPLPHPSGLSTWFRKDPGKALLGDALHCISRHPAWVMTMPPQSSL
ncbi:MAG: Hypothetical protein VC0266 (sugar utilization related?) [uncultured Thiotrichaceae bacterium]|uniref:Uracil-DNA glycosylase-like domain-containing protein n=1 Tax=uncultured Thiotrichaceae bacterium TaxID=298394 RepID=A0A6S6RUG0_9GAMM|nr:MAG: Hypothetical protein VC0266 (sugar utilization related?) [uncultured Thiotrichaceae bacterium]